MYAIVFLILALVCFGVNAVPNNRVRFNLDAAGKAFLVGALVASQGSGLL